MEDNLKEAAAAAWKEVLAHPAADLKNYLEAKGVVFKGSNKPGADVCPICKKKNKFALLPGENGGWIYKCVMSDCDAHTPGGIEKFVQLESGCDWREARRILHHVTGIPGFDEMLEERKRSDNEKPKSERSGGGEETPVSGGGDEDIEAPEYITIPDIGRNPYEEAWSRMILTDVHRKELRTKRGLPDKWIDSLGFKSSRTANRAALDPLLEMFPPNELLRCGIAVRQKNDWKKLRIADQLCGGYWERDEQTNQAEWVNAELPIIPYIDEHGRIVGLRPHKRGLSNGAFREDEASEFYEKNNNNLTLVYGEHFLKDRPERHAHRCIICEGEFKADALGFCGIPAIGFQGITFLRNNNQTGQAITYIVGLLRKHKIREVIVAFDVEDKTNKPVKKPRDKFIAEIHARNTALILENHGFKSLYGMMPEEWMEGGGLHPDGYHTKGKADWDGRLAWHLRKAKGNFSKGRKTATDEFEKFFSNRSGKRPAVIPVPRQMDWQASFKEDVIWQELNRLQFEPDCFVGGKHEIEVAAEITGYCNRDYRDLLTVDHLAQALRKTYGGYYLIKPPNKDLMPRIIDAKKEILWMLDAGTTKPDKAGNTTDLSEDTIRGLRAALLACNTILYKMPEPFSNFTIVSHYKVLVTEPDGTTRKDRLCRFVDSNGRRTKDIQIQWDKMSSSQEARKVFLKIDGLHFSGGQKQIDAMVPTIDVNNYQQTITEIDTYGYDRESKLVLLGDCALAESEDKPFIFPDDSGIIWYRGIGYKNSESLSTFCHKPPMLFPEDGKPKEIYAAMDWEEERKAVEKIMDEALCIAIKSFGDMNGLIMVAGILQYLAHPETLEQIPGKPGLWVQGAKGSGKTQTIMAFMRMLGYPINYGTVGLTGTKVGIERSLSQFDCLPVHIDEWRNIRASDELVGFITNSFNGLSIAKGTAQGSKSIRLSRAATIPVVTGEDMTTDTALLSRYIRLTMSASARSGTPQEQRENYDKMQELSSQFYRIGRFLMRQRKEFSRLVVENAKAFNSNAAVMDAIRDPRARECTSIAFSALDASLFLIQGTRMPSDGKVAKWFINQGRVNSEEIEKDIFRLRWFSDCVGLITGNVDHDAKKYLQVRHCTILQDGSVKPIKGNNGEILRKGTGRLLILVAWKELFTAYQRDQSRRRETVPIDVRNIRQELGREPYWIPPPSGKGNGTHRFVVEGFKPQSWWVMDYETSGDLKNIVSTIYERFLYEHELELDDSGRVIGLDEQTEPLGF